MKKIARLCTMFACLLMVGCAASTGQIDVLQSQVSELQKELDSLQPQPEPPSPAESESAEAPEEPVAGPAFSDKAAVEEGPVAGDTVESYDIADLEAAVDSITDKISTATVSGDAQTDRAAFRELHKALESVEAQLEQMEDRIEADVRGGILTRSEYRELDRQLDILEEQLDRAEDALEFAFGVE